MSMTTKEMIEIMQAYEDGKKIESRQVFLDEDEPWVDESCPSWNWVGFEYRVKPELKYRPYKDTAEMIADLRERGRVWFALSMPLIWIRDTDGCSWLVTVYRHEVVHLSNGICLDMKYLLEDYTYLDGTPCGKEVSDGQKI